jgi:hypothetical protein
LKNHCQGYPRARLLARLGGKKRRKKGLLRITSGCVNKVKLGAHGHQLNSRAIEKVA